MRTNKELYMALIPVIANSDVLTEEEKTELTAFVENKVAQLDKKATTVTKAQREKAVANAKLSDEVYDALCKVDRLIKVGDLIKEVDTLSGYSTQKITPILSGLIAAGKVERVNVKRENLYRVIGDDTTENDDTAKED